MTEFYGSHGKSSPGDDRYRPRRRKPGYGAVAVVFQDGEFLVIRRSAFVRAPNLLCFTGGTIESGETPQQAIVREMREELNVESTARELIWQSTTQWGTRLEWLVVDLAPGATPVPNPREVAECMWIHPSRLLVHPDLLGSVPDFFVAWANGEFTLPPAAGQPAEDWKHFREH
ncbi:MAG: NUDIX domain-containing protein [Planctomycetales bacterium]|nr:NUDIX domain-containing protein [Planctomycetales bacterium]